MLSRFDWVQGHSHTSVKSSRFMLCVFSLLLRYVVFRRVLPTSTSSILMHAKPLPAHIPYREENFRQVIIEDADVIRTADALAGKPCVFCVETKTYVIFICSATRGKIDESNFVTERHCNSEEDLFCIARITFVCDQCGRHLSTNLYALC